MHDICIIAIEDIARLDFDMLSYTIEELNLFAFKIFKFLNYHTSLGIKDETLKGLIREISDNYNIVPYHHFTHGFSVFQVRAYDFRSETNHNFFQDVFRYS